MKYKNIVRGRFLVLVTDVKVIFKLKLNYFSKNNSYVLFIAIFRQYFLCSGRKMQFNQTQKNIFDLSLIRI